MTVTKEQIIKSLEETIREVKTMPSDNFKALCNNVKTPCEHCAVVIRKMVGAECVIAH